MLAATATSDKQSPTSGDVTWNEFDPVVRVLRKLDGSANDSTSHRSPEASARPCGVEAPWKIPPSGTICVPFTEIAPSSVLSPPKFCPSPTMKSRLALPLPGHGTPVKVSSQLSGVGVSSATFESFPLHRTTLRQLAALLSL